MAELIEAVILAGGLSSRMGTNKSLVLVQNKPMIDHVYERLNSQVKRVWINSNFIFHQFPEKDQFKDQIINQHGPLVGIYSGLKLAGSEWVQFCPTDSPFLPLNLVEKLYRKTISSNNKVIVPSVDGKIEPVFSLCHKSTLEALASFILSCQKKISDWIEHNNFETVTFDNPDEFRNINDPDELKKIEP